MFLDFSTVSFKFGFCQFVYRCGRIIGHFTVHRMVGYIFSGRSLLAGFFSSGDLEIRTGRFMTDGMVLPRVIANKLLHSGQTHSEPTRGSPRS